MENPTRVNVPPSDPPAPVEIDPAAAETEVLAEPPEDAAIGLGRPPRLETYENAACMALLVLLAFLTLLPAWTDGRVPFSADYAFTLAPWRDAQPEGLSPAAAALSEAQTTRYLPWYAFLSDSVARGDSLLWNPREGAGTPFMALWRTRVFSPFTLPFYLLPLALALTVSALLKLIVAGWCAFYVGRRFGLAAPMALLLAVAYQLGGHVFLRIDAPISDVAPWLPLALLFAEQVASEYWMAWPFGCLVWALMLFGGDPELVLATLGFVVLYLAGRFVGERARWPEAAGGLLALALSVFLGAALAAVQILPYLELLREAAATGRYPLAAPLGWRDLGLLFLPGSVALPDAAEAAANLVARARTVPLLYIGVVPLVFLPLWAATRRFAPPLLRSRVDVLIGVAALFTLAGAVASRIAPTMPPFAWFNTEHYLAFNAIAATYASAAAAQQWVVLNARQCTSAIPRLLMVLAGFLIVTLVLAGFGRETTLGAALWTLGLALVLIAALAVTLVRPSVRILGYAAVAATVVAMGLAQSRSAVFRDPGLLFPGTPFVAALDQGGGRIAGSPMMARWPLAGNGIYQYYNSDGVQLKRHRIFSARLQQEPLLVRRVGSATLLLTGEDIQGPFARLRPSLESRTVFDTRAILFQDLEPVPRARMVYAGRPSRELDPHLIGADDPPLMETELPALQPATVQAEAVITRPESNAALHIHVAATQPGVLVVADAWYPGWKAIVNGEEREVFPVDGLFRGVVLPEGTHDVLMVYDPIVTELGLGISVAAAILIAAGLGAVAYGRYLRRPHPHASSLIPPA